MDELKENYASAFIDDTVEELYKSRKIYINEDIDENIVEKVIMFIFKFNSEDTGLSPYNRKKIYLYINSDGGDCVAGINLIDVIEQSKTPIVTVGLSKCASMGLYILASGHERYCFKNTVFLLHDGQTGYVSTANKGKDIQRFFEGLENRLSSKLFKKTRIDSSYLEEVKDREKYFWGDEALDLGLVDDIIGEGICLDGII